jgi:RND superfamily putative drug exporter
VLCFILLPIFVPALMALPDALENAFSGKKAEALSLDQETL